MTLAQCMTDYHLTRRQQEVARLLIGGLSNKGIGHLLFIQPQTVANHVSRILAKTHADSRTMAAYRLTGY